MFIIEKIKTALAISLSLILTITGLVPINKMDVVVNDPLSVVQDNSSKSKQQVTRKYIKLGKYKEQPRKYTLIHTVRVPNHSSNTARSNRNRPGSV